MPDDIRARIVFDMKGAAGGMGGKVSQPGIGLGKLTAGVALGNLLQKGILKGVNSLVEASPRLQAQLKIFKKGLMLILRPIGNVIANWVKPFVMQFLRFGMKFYKDYQSGGFWYAFKEALGTIDWAAAAQTALTAILAISIAKLGLGALAAALGVGVVGTSLLVPLALALAGITLGKALGLTGFESILLGVIGFGAYLIAGGGVTGALIAIPIVLAIAGIMWSARETGMSKFMEETQETITFTKDLKTGIDDVKDSISNMAITGSAGLSDVKTGIKDLLDTMGFGGEGISVKGKGPFGMLPPIPIGLEGFDTGQIEEIKSFAETIRSPFLKFVDIVDIIIKKFTVGDSPAILDYPKIFAQGFMTQLPPLKSTFTDVFNAGLIKNALEPSILKSRQLFNELMRLNTTVTTTHIIRTIREER